MPSSPGLSTTSRDKPWTAILIAGLGALLCVRLAALYWNATDLFFDEAQYWAWSEQPAFGYFSKPPLVAWLIRVATEVCGPGEACVRLPREAQTWQAAARLLAKRGQNREAIETLLEGSRRFRSPRLRPQAIHLLRRARELDPWDFQLVFELARLLRRSGQRHESGLLLDGLAQRCGGERLRRVRGAQLRLAPGLGSAWRWLHAALRPAAEPRGGSGGQAGRTGVVPLRIAPRR
jgi:hypothetical protein